MRIFRDISRLSPETLRSPAVTLGVFDGVHTGHRAILAALSAAAARTGGETVLVTFDRHPRAVVAPPAPPTITSLEHRIVLFERAGLDAVVVLHFDEELAAMSAEAFLGEVLVGRIGAKVIVLGPDSHFGCNREGSTAFVEARRARYGYDLIQVPFHDDGGGAAGTTSSTAIRRAVAEGSLDDAARMLGRPFALLGRVDRGDQRGRTIGFPTANLSLHHEVTPPRGVYVAAVLVDQVRYRALVNFGVRPTFQEGQVGPPREICEVHLLGFEGNLYGRALEVALLRRLRDERKFGSVDDLVAQIRADREQALEDVAGG